MHARPDLAMLELQCERPFDPPQRDDVKCPMARGVRWLGGGVLALGVAAVLVISHMSSAPTSTAVVAFVEQLRDLAIKLEEDADDLRSTRASFRAVRHNHRT